MISPAEIKQKALNKYNDYLEIVAENILLGKEFGAKFTESAFCHSDKNDCYQPSGRVLPLFFEEKNASLASKAKLVAAPAACHSDRSGRIFFPLQIKSDKGKVHDDFSTRQKEYVELYAQSKNKTGSGYLLIEEKVTTRKSGEQTKIKEIRFETEADYLGFIGKNREFKIFCKNLSFVNEQYFANCNFSNLNFSFEYKMQWQKKFRLILMDSKNNEDFWKNIFLCATWFLENKNSNLYIREIPLNVHTKFIEENKVLIHSLVTENKLENFEKEFGLKTEENFIRFRSLDENLQFEFNGIKISDIQLKESEFEKIGESDFAAKNFSAKINKIFIVENKMIYLAFPKVPNAICVWGEGFGKTKIPKTAWFAEKEIFYFGDIDEHGFEILSGFRKYNQKIKSFCMDKNVLESFAEFRVAGKTIKTPIGELNLTEEEKGVLRELQADRTKNRLEQERIGQWYIKQRCTRLANLE